MCSVLLMSPFFLFFYLGFKRFLAVKLVAVYSFDDSDSESA